MWKRLIKIWHIFVSALFFKIETLLIYALFTNLINYPNYIADLSSALQEFVQCKNIHVTIDCGERAGIFMQKHLYRITNPIMDQHCSAYTYGPDACSQRYPQTSEAVNNWSAVNGVELIITLLLILFLC